MATVAQELLAWRRAFRLTQAQAAELLHIGRSTYQAFEKGYRVPPYREIQRLHALVEAADFGARHALDGQVDWKDVS